MKKAEKIIQQVKDGYNQIAEQFSNTRQAPWQEFNLFKEYIKDGQKILDAGCGNGRLFFSVLKDYNVEYQGIDNSEKLIEIAKKKISKFQIPISKQIPNPNFQIADMTDIPFADNYFDLVICIAAFHHLPTKKFRLKSLSEINRVLKPNGHLLMTNWYWQYWPFWKYFFNNFWQKSLLLDFFFPWKSATGQERCLRFYHIFTKSELIKLHKKTGLKIIKIFPDLDTYNKKAYKRGVNIVSVASK